MNDNELLLAYVINGNEAAFTELVGRHIAWVQISAQRQMRGDPGTAQEVTQAVFILLASKAPKLCERPDLISWLFGAVRYCAKSARRSEQRRMVHEQKAAAMTNRLKDNQEAHERDLDELLPNLDEMIARLGTTDRQAILLRFFQKKTLVEVDASMGISHEAAKKRVARAVDRMRTFFARDGVVLPAGAIMTAMEKHAILPGGPQAAHVATTAMHTTINSTASNIAAGASKMMITPVKAALALAAVGALAVGGGTVLLLVHNPATTLAATQASVVAPQTISVPIVQVEAAPDQSTPGNLIRRIDYASAQGDKRMLLGCVIRGSAEEARMMDGLFDVIVSTAQVHAAAVQQFGKDAQSAAVQPSAAPRLLSDDRWHIAGDRATGFDPHMSPTQSVAVREGNIWKLDVSASNIIGPKAHEASFRTLVALNQKLIKRIIAGEIASAKDVQEELMLNRQETARADNSAAAHSR